MSPLLDDEPKHTGTTNAISDPKCGKKAFLRISGNFSPLQLVFFPSFVTTPGFAAALECGPEEMPEPGVPRESFWRKWKKGDIFEKNGGFH